MLLSPEPALIRLLTNRVVRHVVFWVGLCGLLVSIDLGNPAFYNTDTYQSFRYFFPVSVPVMMAYVYSLVYGLLPLLVKRQFDSFSVTLIALNGVLWPISKMMNGHNYVPDQLVLNNLASALFISGRIFLAWHQKQRENQQLERQKLQSDLQLLKLQLNPDFLFGSLRALQELSQKRAKQAPNVVLAFAQLLRYMIYESAGECIPLDREVDVIGQYVFLQKIMHTDSLEVAMTVRGVADNQQIVPLSLLSVVEWAFRQLPIGTTDEPAWISIDLAVGKTDLTLKVITGQIIPKPITRMDL